ncbi:MAG: flavodoxin domain-containing protein [Candidatus Bathyarchaeia archaeon]|jgi:flavodoxin I
MNPVIIYFSRGGNTRKVAEAMAEELKIRPIDVKKETPDVSNTDLLIIGSGTYGGKPGEELVAYLENLKQVTGKRAACFSSCAGDATKTLAAMKEILNTKGYTVVDCFSCFGKFAGLTKRGHPSEEEIAQAREFARQLISSS